MSQSPASERLFVYGTLAPGRPNAHVLDDVPGTWEEASVAGRLVQHGWGAAHGYPAIELSNDAASVEGFVLVSPALPEHWDRLDEFEGDAYERVVAQVQLRDGRRVPANVYVAYGHDSVTPQ